MDKTQRELGQQHGQSLYDFLVAFHEDRPFEIRFVPEIRGRGFSISLMRDGDFFYMGNREGGFIRVAPFSWEGIYEYIGLVLLNAVGLSAPCFTINSPNFARMTRCVTTDEDITEGGTINVQAVDMDAPEEVRNDEKLLEQWKDEKAEQILTFPLQPSCVTETKNGYHVYWLLIDGKVHLYRHIQMQLIQFFDGDEKCINESRLMRLPGYNHEKNPHRKFPVLRRIWKPERRYRQEELKASLPELEDETIHRILKERADYIPNRFEPTRKNKVLNLLKGKLDVASETTHKMIAHCCMPHHSDRNPSAWVDTEYMWFHCSGCGTHLPLDELSSELEWHDILQELERYDTDIDSELARIQSLKMDAAEFLPIEQEPEAANIANQIVSQVLAHFESIGQNINQKHRSYIRDLAHVLVYGQSGGKTNLIPLDMGGGKSTILKFYLLEMLKSSLSFGAIVAVERNDTVKQFVREFNRLFGTDTAFAMYGFDIAECLRNVHEKANHQHCTARSYPYRCPYKADCRYYNQFDEQKNYPIVVITFKRLHIDLDKLHDKYGNFRYRGTAGQRVKFIIDEKPFLTMVHTLSQKQFESYSKQILNDLLARANEHVIHEYQHVISLIHPIFESTPKKEWIQPLDHEFRFSDEFWNTHRKLYAYTQEIYAIPEVFESIVRNGGHKTSSNETVEVITSNVNDYTTFSDFHTLIFDGTADIDLDYQHEKYNLLNFDPIRSFEELEFFVCDSISASMTSFQEEEKVRALCEDVRRISAENPNDILYFPVFKRIEKQAVGYLWDEIESGKILVAHYGETRGSNRFKDCSVLVIGGILHKGEDFYIEKARAIYGQRNITLGDIDSTKVGQSRRFNETLIEQVKLLDMLVDYSQEIKRTSQRDNSRNVKGKVFIFHNDKLLLDRIGMKFPKCKVTSWAPMSIVETGILSQKRNKNQQTLLSFIKECRALGKKEIYYEDIGQRLNINSNATSKLIKTKKMRAYLVAQNIRVVSDGKEAKLVLD